MWVQENAVLNLSCEASGHPRPTISWSVEGMVSRPTAPAEALLWATGTLPAPPSLSGVPIL